jgi:hypothetical protein
MTLSMAIARRTTSENISNAVCKGAAAYGELIESQFEVFVYRPSVFTGGIRHAEMATVSITDE